MLTEARSRLAQAQTDLVRALVAQGPIPGGFDEARVKAAARALVSKRRQSLMRAWPRIAKLLGGAFVSRFDEYAASHPLPASASTLADGRAFLRWLGSMSDELAVEALSFDLRFLDTPTRLRRRRWGIQYARLANVRVLAVRIPWLGERWWRFSAN